MTFNEEFMKQALKRVDELKQETIEKSKQIPNSEAYVKEKLKASGIVSHSRCVKCKKILNISKLKDNPNSTGKVCLDEKVCRDRIEKANR